MDAADDRPGKGAELRREGVERAAESVLGDETEALKQAAKTLDALARLDPVAAASIVREDFAIDEEFRGIVRQLITFMMEDPRTISQSLEILWIAKAIERIGDHSKNMAEQVIYIVKGTDVRHTTVEELEREARG